MGYAKKLKGSKVINGTYGHCVIDGEEISACKALQAKYDVDVEDILLPDQFAVDHVPTKANGKGSVTLYKIDSYFHKLVGEKLKKGEPTEFSIVTQLKDPKAFGSEAIAIENVYFTDLTIADWERGKNGEIEAPFVFGNYEPIDLI